MCTLPLNQFFDTDATVRFPYVSCFAQKKQTLWNTCILFKIHKLQIKIFIFNILSGNTLNNNASGSLSGVPAQILLPMGSFKHLLPIPVRQPEVSQQHDSRSHTLYYT